jgi:hypothetical protein
LFVFGLFSVVERLIDTFLIIIIIIIIIISQGCKVTLLWNQQVKTDRTIPNNKPDIIIPDNENGTCMLIDLAISGDRNVIKKKPRRF